MEQPERSRSAPVKITSATVDVCEGLTTLVSVPPAGGCAAAVLSSVVGKRSAKHVRIRVLHQIGGFIEIDVKNLSEVRISLKNVR